MWTPLQVSLFADPLSRAACRTLPTSCPLMPSAPCRRPAVSQNLPHLTPPDARHLLPSPHSHRLSSPDCKGLQPSVPILKPWILYAPWFLHISLWSEGSNSLIHCVPHVPPASPTTAGLRDSFGADGAACVHESQCLTQRTPAHPLAPPAPRGSGLPFPTSRPPRQLDPPLAAPQASAPHQMSPGAPRP